MRFYQLLLASIASTSLMACGGQEAGTAKPEAPEEPAQVETAPEATKEAFTVPSIPTLPAASEDLLRSYVKTLSSDDFEGRAPATAGGRKTVEWLETTMKDIGLKPANGDSYRQNVPLVELTLTPEESSFIINTPDGGSKTLSYREESVYWTKRVVDEVKFDNSDVVFVGYGVVAPEYNWNDYEGIDVEGKTVVMLVNDPGFATEDPELFNGKSMTYYGRWTYKYEEAARQGATAAIVVHQTAPAAYGWGVVEGSWSGPQLDLERPDGGASRVALEGWVTEETAASLFTSAGLDFQTAQKAALSADFTAMPLTGVTASAKITNKISRDASQNVAGYIEGTTHPDEYVLYIGHWDHLGVGTSSDENADLISNGAVDNATGTGGIIAIADAFIRAETKPERSIVFMGVTAEESGLLGSAYFAEDPFIPLNKIIGGINIDAILPSSISKDIIVVGYGASELEDLLKAATDKRGMYLRPDAEPEKGYFYRSDHISLAKKGVPMIYADSGIDLVEGGVEAGKAFSEDYVKNRYHNPADEYSDDWRFDGIMNTLSVLQEVGAYMAYSDVAPNWYEGNEFRELRDRQLSE